MRSSSYYTSVTWFGKVLDALLPNVQMVVPAATTAKYAFPSARCVGDENSAEVLLSTTCSLGEGLPGIGS